MGKGSFDVREMICSDMLIELFSSLLKWFSSFLFFKSSLNPYRKRKILQQDLHLR